jgi:hypothetical protein
MACLLVEAEQDLVLVANSHMFPEFFERHPVIV